VLRNWANKGMGQSMVKTSNKLAKRYRRMIRSGIEPDKRSEPLDPDTMSIPIRVGDKGSPIRSSVNQSATPLVATGRTVNSIKSKKTSGFGSVKFTIGSDDRRANNILTANAFGEANWNHGGGKRRDPLRVTNKEIDFIEEEIVKELDKVIKKAF